MTENPDPIQIKNQKQALRINFSKLRKILVGLLSIAIIFFSGYFFGSSGFKVDFEYGDVSITRELPVNRQDLDFSLFWRVWDSLDESYFDKSKLKPVEMVLGAIKGMVSAVGDPYTVFLPPDENKVVQEDLQGSFDGVGIQIGFRGSRLAVIAPLPETPAEKAGIKAGDFIIGIKDEVKGIDVGTVGMTLPEAVELIRGPSGSTVTLTLLRDDSEEPLQVDVVRASIDVASVILTFVDENGETGGEQKYAHIRVLKFSGETQEEWDAAVRDVLKNSSVEGAILDLRNNPGGFLQGAVDIAGEFLEIDSTVVIEENSKGEKGEFIVDRFGKLLDSKVVVLVNKGSASASEILAGALRDIDGSLLVGESTFGKGTIQEPRQINGGAALHITTSKWLTPNEFWVDEAGLTPDVEVEDNPDTTEDEQLLRAIEVLN